jgi:DNA-directed RNA polymerase subunit N (RpoN/RPB10)
MTHIQCSCGKDLGSYIQAFSLLKLMCNLKLNLSAEVTERTSNVIEGYDKIFIALNIPRERLCCRMHLMSTDDFMQYML